MLNLPVSPIAHEDDHGDSRDRHPALRSRRVDAAVANAVFTGLTSRDKSLPPWLLYDEAGAALFEAITSLAEYYPTRTERAILAANADDMIDRAHDPDVIVELGAGSAEKTEHLLRASLRRRSRVGFVPVDVSPELPVVAARLREQYPGVTITPISARYPEQLAWLGDIPGRRLVAFLGSSIGNDSPREAIALLRAVRAEMRPGDALLLGTDLVKPSEVLLPAYDDRAGVTARFNRNVLARINRELGANFDLDGFRHVAIWNPVHQRIELYLESLVAQTVSIEALRLKIAFRRGERLHTENSHKFTVAGIRHLLVQSGLAPEASWQDPRGWFALTLATV